MPRIITAGHAAVIARTVECCEAVLQLIPLDTPLFSDSLIRTALMIGRAREAAHMLPAADWDLMRDDITPTEKRNITGTLQLCELVLQRRTDGVSVAEETIHCLGGDDRVPACHTRDRVSPRCGRKPRRSTTQTRSGE